MRLGSWEILREVGRGATSIVYEARSAEGIDAALKLYTDPQRAPGRIERERRIQLKLGVAGGFVPLLDHGEAPEGVYLVMPFARGGTLRTRMKRPLSVPEVLELARTLSAAMARAHAARVIHRDLKPENILFTAEGTPLIADLGLAKVVRDSASDDMRSVSLTRTNALQGTAGYMPPEQMKDSRTATARADVYALGAILYECLAGRPAFPGETLAEVFISVQRGELVPLRRARRDVPAWLATIVERALSHDPAARFADAGELERALSDQDVSAVTSRVIPPPPPWRRAAFALGALAVVASVVWGLAIASRARREEALRAARDELASIERDAASVVRLEALETRVADLLATAPRELVASIELSWMRTLHRRGRWHAARALATKHASDPGDDGLDATRVLADMLLDTGAAKDAAPLLAKLGERPGTVHADWAAARALQDGKRIDPGVRSRIESGADPMSLRALALADARAGHERTATLLLERVVSDLARDDARAHLALVQTLRRHATAADLRGEQDSLARQHLDEFERLAGPDAAAQPAHVVECARTSLAAREWDAMLRVLDAGIASGLDDVEVHGLRAWILDEKGLASRERAVALDAARAEALAPRADDAWGLATVLPPSALERLRWTAGTADPAARERLLVALRAAADGAPGERVESAFREARAAAPGCPVVAREEVRALVGRFRVASAREAIARARGVGVPEPDLLVLEALLAVRSLALERAEELVAKLAALVPNDERTLAARALLLSADGDAPGALIAARAAVARAPASPLARLALGEAALANVDVDEAFTQARCALALGGRAERENELLLLRATPLEPASVTRESASRRRAARGLEPALEAPAPRNPALLHARTLETEDPSARLFNARAAAVLAAMGRSAARSIPLSAYAIVEADLRRAIEDSSNPLGPAMMGCFIATLAAADAEGPVRENWLKARAIEPRWRMPRGWRGLREKFPKLVDEFAEAPR